MDLNNNHIIYFSCEKFRRLMSKIQRHDENINDTKHNPYNIPSNLGHIQYIKHHHFIYSCHLNDNHLSTFIEL